MALSTYDELKTAIGTWLDRPDLPAGDLVELAEGNLNMVLRCRDMQASVSLVQTSGVCTLPTDFRGVISVTAETSPRTPLTQISRKAGDEKYGSETSGYSANYSILGSELKIYPTSSANINLLYYQSIPALSSSNTSNWLLERYPNIYLKACQKEALEYTRDAAGLAIIMQQLVGMVESLNDEATMDTGMDGSMVFEGVAA